MTQQARSEHSPTSGQTIIIGQEDVIENNDFDTLKLDDAIKLQADNWISSVLNIENNDLDKQHAASVEIANIGGQLESELSELSQLLQAPMSELIKDAENGGDIANKLLELESTARSIDPNGHDFSSMSGFRVFLTKLGLPSPLQIWAAKFQSTESIIHSIGTGLQQGGAKLERDNITLKNDQLRYRKKLLKLDDYISFTQYVDQQMSLKVDAAVLDTKRFLIDEVLFPVRQRYQDLLTAKMVYQQAWVTSEFVIKTNNELIRGVNRARQNTLVALGVAASLAIALARQKKVLLALESTKKVTEEMISSIADQLFEQGTAVMDQASEPFLQVEVMKAAFTKTLAAMQHVSDYRAKAVVNMKKSIEEMGKLSTDMNHNIQRIEQGRQANDEFKVLLG
jgi:uncharacterized protein YaaN involved in tellurite resistance